MPAVLAWAAVMPESSESVGTAARREVARDAGGARSCPGFPVPVCCAEVPVGASGDPGDAAFLEGQALHRSGDVAGAEAAWRRGHDLGHAYSSINLSVLLRRHGEEDAAQEVMQLADDRGSPEAAYRSAFA